jgi:predicted Zn finger-like uncharacterized protein
MIIQCQGCAAKYFLPEEKVPEKAIKVRCPKCQAVFTLAPRVETVPAGALPPPLDVDPPVAEATPETPRRRRSGHGKEERAKRLARVLVSDILIYNRERRDEALSEGTLMTTLGEEIKKSWELYKEKVGPEVAGSTNYFKEALNEILADGQEVF